VRSSKQVRSERRLGKEANMSQKGGRGSGGGSSRTSLVQMMRTGSSKRRFGDGELEAECAVSLQFFDCVIKYIAEVMETDEEKILQLSMREIVHGKDRGPTDASHSCPEGSIRKMSVTNDKGYSLVELMKLPKQGYKLREDMSNFLPKKMTKDEDWKQAWFHQGSKEKRDVMYVSHAWDLPLKELLDSLEGYASEQEKEVNEKIRLKEVKDTEKRECLFWIDVFAINQHKADRSLYTEEDAHLHSDFQINVAESIMSNCELGVLLVFHPLETPLSLTRLWVWYELQLANRNKFEVRLGIGVEDAKRLEADISNLDVLSVEKLPKEEREQAIGTSLNFFDSLRNLKLDQTDITFEDDKKKIMARIGDDSSTVSRLFRRDLAELLLSKARALSKTAHTGKFTPLIRKLITYFDDDRLYVAKLQLDLANALRILGGKNDAPEQVLEALQNLDGASECMNHDKIEERMQCLGLQLKGFVLRAEIESRVVREGREKTMEVVTQLKEESEAVITSAHQLLRDNKHFGKAIAMDFRLEEAQSKYWEGRLFYLLHSNFPDQVLPEYMEDCRRAVALLDESVKLFDKLDSAHRHFNRGAALAVKGGLIAINKNATYNDYSNPYKDAFTYWRKYFPEDGEVVNYKYSHVFWILQHGDYKRALTMLDGHGGDLRKFALAGNVQKLKYLDWGLSRLQCIRNLKKPKDEVVKHMKDMMKYLDELKDAGFVWLGTGGYGDRCDRITAELSNDENLADTREEWESRVQEVFSFLSSNQK